MSPDNSTPIARSATITSLRVSVLSLLFGLLTGLAATAGLAQDHDHGATPATNTSDAHAQHTATGDSTQDTSEAIDNSDTSDHSEHNAMPASNVGDAHTDHGDTAAPMNMDMNNRNTLTNNLRDPHAYSNGLERGEGPYAVEGPGLHLADEMYFGGLRMNRLERLFVDGADSTLYDAQFWFGSSYDQLVIKAEGEFVNESFEGGDTDVLWSHAILGFWNTQLGIRNETGEGPDRNWLAIGMQGIAPYWFEVDATAYLGSGGRTAFNIEAEYELLLTQRLILEPRLEMNFYGENDRARNVGSGLSDSSVGLRLKYQINRQIIPYFGVEQVRQYGDTAKFTDSKSGDSDTRWVAGLRFWF